MNVRGHESPQLSSVGTRLYALRSIPVRFFEARIEQDYDFSTDGITYNSHFFIRIATFEMTWVALPACV